MTTSSPKTPFHTESFMKMLQVLQVAPDSQLDKTIAKKAKEFLEDAHTPVELWNLYKEMLDIAVHIGGASGFVIQVLDLERFYTPPEGKGVFLQSDGSIENAPWRNK